MLPGVELLPLIIGLIGLIGLITAVAAYRLDKKRSADDGVSFNRPSIVSSETVSPAEVSRGMRGLIEYCLHKKPDYIVGLNRGGVMVGAYVALSMGIPSKNFLRCCVTVLADSHETECDFSDISGVVIVVDSITRTGKTMSHAVNELKGKFPKISHIHVASLVATLDKKGKPICNALNFYTIGTNNTDIDLPWTIPYHKVGDAKRAQHIKDDFLLVHEKEVGDIAKDLYSDLDKVNLAKG